MTRASRTLALAALAAGLSGCVTMTAFDRGVLDYQQGRYLAAIEAFDDAIHLHPRSVAAYNNRGLARVRIGDYTSAIADYSEALRIAPRDPELLFNRGNAFVLAGDLARAIADFGGAIDLRPGYSRALFNRGAARAIAGDAAGARADWAEAIEVEPDPRMKAALRKSAGFDVAPLAPAPAMSLAPGPAVTPQQLDARALAARGLSRELDGDRAGAIEDLRAALAIETDPARRASIEHLLRALLPP